LMSGAPERIGVLLGAGASVDAQIPDTTGMTRRIVESVMSEENSWGPASRSAATALNYVVATLNARETLRSGSGPFSTVDVERVFAAVQALSDRDGQDISSFVGSWSSDILQVDSAADSELGRLAGDLKSAILDIRFPSESRISQILRAFVEKTTGASSGQVFEHTLRAMIDALRTALAIESNEQVAYMRPLADFAAAQSDGLMVATLNYDLVVETMAKVAGVSCSTGMETWADEGRWAFAGYGIQLLKLHGSINWRLAPRPRSTPGFMPEQEILEVESTDGRQRDVPAIVFGQTKLRPDGPFIELLLEFARRLEQIDHLVIVGYSFRDDHVNERLRRWINGDLRRRITVIDPGMPEQRARWGGYEENVSFRDQLLGALIPPEPTRTPDGSIAIPVRPEHQFEARLVVVSKKTKDALGPVLEGQGL
jgi:hypothetical protein